MSGTLSTKASHHASPLRYPGGKAKLGPYFKALIKNNKLYDCVYFEPFAGGAGVGLTLLVHGYVSRIVLNDLSYPIYCFWRALLDNPEKFKARIRDVALSVDEWTHQRDVFRAQDTADPFELGFAAFYLNRTNRSGVLNGGMIGGYAQTSKYGLDARFNRDELAARVERLARNRDNIEVHNLDANNFIQNIPQLASSSKSLVYIDPPYYKKGRDLYYDFYLEKDHAILRDAITSLGDNINWVVSYDNEPEIVELYSRFRALFYNLGYSVRNGRVGREAMFFCDRLEIPELYEGGLEEISAAA